MVDRDGFGFLGEEFLTWLWFRLETDGGDFDLGDGRSVAVSLDDFIAFAPGEDDETEPTLRKGTPSLTAEAGAALRHGRRLSRARLLIALGDSQWRVTLDGSTMTLRSIRLPDDDPEAESAEDRARERAANFLLVHDIVAALYRTFLRVRLRPEYLAQEAHRQAAWMASRRA
jgi:hypothetical protein